MLPSLREELRNAERFLISHHIADARLEAEMLLMHTLEMGRIELYVRLEEPLCSETAKVFWHLVRRRCSNEPTAYILKQCQFYGIDLYIDPRALIPRPESELLVEEGLRFASQRFPPPVPCLIAEVGTGSGAIAIALALHLPQAKIYATDISTDALEVARINCEQHQVTQRVHLLLGDMLHPLPQRVDIIMANLPYVRDAELEEVSPEIKDFEPRVALAGGVDGLNEIRRLLSQAEYKLLPGGLVLLEMGHGQAGVVASLAGRHFPNARIDLIPDLGGIERVASVLDYSSY